jgi:hypothetical protein
MGQPEEWALAAINYYRFQVNAFLTIAPASALDRVKR